MDAPSDSRVRLHVVTGKGGAGKTTVAAAMALALTARGQRVLLVEVEGRQGISQVLDVAPLGSTERSLVTDPSGGELLGLAVDAKSALLEYLQKFYKLGRAGSVLEKVGAIDFATTIAPGVRDVLLIGKVYEAVGRRTKGAKKRPVYDAVVLDAPPTGRIGKFLAVNSEVSEVARIGPIRTQADSITRLLQSPGTAVHVVTLLEEMPVQETRDAIDELGDLSLRVGSVVVNGERPPLLTDEQAAEIREEGQDVRDALTTALGEAGIKAGPAMVTGLLREGGDHVLRTELQEEQRAILAELPVPVHTLPHLPEGVESGGLRLLAGSLDEQGGV
ncbi:MAG: ArsA-related P-loop ATPase [Janibacter sp.]